MTFPLAKNVLFVGMGASGVCYYRIMLPAMGLGCDWMGASGDPRDPFWVTGTHHGGDPRRPDFEKYSTIVVQQPNDPRWFEVIERWRAKGIKVIYEVDDYLHAIPKMADHDFKDHYTKEYLKLAETAMGLCDAMIVSTEYIAKRYRKFNSNIYVCENGLDLRRYELTKPKRKTVNIGWAGGTGHRDAIVPWLREVAAVMMARPETAFVSVGQDYARALARVIGEDRTITIPWCQVEQYPGAMTMFDIALAPAGNGGFFRGKSDLRWLEAGALGVPIIANPMVYSKITDGVDGFLAPDPVAMSRALVSLIDNPELRTGVGEKARTYVRENRSLEKASSRWAQVLTEVTVS